MKEELRKLKNKITSIQTQIARFKVYTDEFDEESGSILELNLRLEKAEQLFEKFDEIQSCIEEFKSVDVTEQVDRKAFEDIYYPVIARVKNIIKERSVQEQQLQPPLRQVDTTASNVSTNTKVQLPALTLPKFSGDYTQWLLFKDTFTSAIHTNDSLNKIEKFRYLRSLLQGDTLQLMSALETTSENYDIAWNLLNNRYENERIIIHTHMKALFDIPTVTKEPNSLRYTIDKFQIHIRALQALKEPVNQWDTILIHLFATKLDAKTRHDWEVEVGESLGKKKPKLQQLLDFLTNRCQILEMTKKMNKLDTNKTTFKKNITLATVAHACVFCKGSHFIFKCDNFLKLSTTDRMTKSKELQLCINCLKPGHFGRDCRSQNCKKCQRRHNTLLHVDTNEKKEDSKGTETNLTTVTNFVQQNYQILLSTAEVLVSDNTGKWHSARALLDSGSQSNFVTYNLAKKLKLSFEEINIPVRSINDSLTTINKQTNLKVKSRLNNFNLNLKCLTLPKITDNIPQVTVNKHVLNIPENLKLADENFNNSAPVELLIGCEAFWKLLCVGQIKLCRNQPILQKTHLGWVISGPISIDQAGSSDINSYVTTNASLENQLEKFWHVEEIHEKREWTIEEQMCEELFKSTVKRDEEGRFETSILQKKNVEFGNTYDGALRRFYAIENRLNKNDDLKAEYISFMKKYESLGHMQVVEPFATGNETSEARMFFLPHHPVIRTGSLTTKVRVVFDGSFKDSTGNSLNDGLYIGPRVQEELFNIIMRFRSHEFVLTADITMMFRQIMIRKEDRNLQQIIWREDPEENVKIYQLKTVTYGTASAPYIATRCLKQLAMEEGNQFPQAKDALFKDFYMDDVLTGSDTISHAKELQKQLVQLLNKAKLDLRKWRSNSNEVLTHLVEEGKETELLVLNKEEDKTLGILWNSTSDTFHYSIKQTEDSRITKRIILSQISQIFDPLGLIGPVVVRAKIIMQELWKLELDWDESVPQSLFTSWKEYSCSLTKISELIIPRNINPKNVQCKIDIHGFCDASEAAYGACIYATSIDKQGCRNTRLLCAKARVAPLKATTLPRLELCGALVLARLISTVQTSLAGKLNQIYLWSDSTIVLAWLQAPAYRLKTFVANRTSEIQKLTTAAKWNHVNSKQNPADLISRGLSAEQLINNTLWWTGPE